MKNYNYSCKTATTIEEQITKLQNRNITIEDTEKAKEQLLDIGYYRLGFYFFPFEESYPKRVNRSHKMKPGTLFDDAVKLYYFDFDLRNLLLRYTSRIEVAFRTYLTYYISNRYRDNPIWFVDKKIVGAKFINYFKNDVYTKKFRDNNIAISTHHKNHPNDRYAPAWKTLEFMDFGSMIMLYKNLQNEYDRSEICRHFNVQSSKAFSNYIDTVRIVRNRCAHGHSLFDYNLVQGIKLDYIKPNGEPNFQMTMAAAISVIVFMLGNISQNRKQEMTQRLREIEEDTIKKTPAIRVFVKKVMNFTE